MTVRNLRRLSSRNPDTYKGYVRRLYLQCAEDCDKLAAAYRNFAMMHVLNHLKGPYAAHHKKLFQEFRNLRYNIAPILDAFRQEQGPMSHSDAPE